MSTKSKRDIPSAVVALLATFQGLFFGITNEALLSELRPEITADEWEEAQRSANIYRPIVEDIRNAIDGYVLAPSRRIGDVAVVDEKSLDINRLISDFMAKYPGAQPELIKTIAQKIYYWKILR